MAADPEAGADIGGARAVEARLAALAEAAQPSTPEPEPQWAEQGEPVTDWATAEEPQADDEVETVDGVLEGTEA